jgi:putative ATPase
MFLMSTNEKTQNIPLAHRMRPKTIDEFVGQTKLIDGNKLIKKALDGDPASMIFWGPPGSGKTTLAWLIGSTAKRPVIRINAVSTGIPALRKILSDNTEENPILFIDEIHRWNKAQQDFLLPKVESGEVTIIGSTTENPYFEVNGPLLSRVRVLRLEPLGDDDIKKIVQTAIQSETGFAGNISVPDDVMEFIINISGGDARSALNILEELAVQVSETSEKPVLKIPDQQFMRRLPYDKSGDIHYQVVSAFIKSLRGSDVDASVYWLVRMTSSGEDPKFIARRMVILASEDIGLADPWAILMANACFQAVERIGMPECEYNLVETAIYLAQAPKSNSTAKALMNAKKAIEKSTPPVPIHLRNPSFKGAWKLGYGKDYKYPHDFSGGYVDQEYLPEELKGLKLYEPSDLGYEKRIKERMKSRNQE